MQYRRLTSANFGQSAAIAWLACLGWGWQTIRAADLPAPDATLTAPAATAPSATAPSAAAQAGAADPSRPDPLLVRVTSSVESKYASAMLRQVAKLFSAGFVRREADGIAHQIDVMPADQKQLWQFATVYKGVHYPLQIRARVDDFGMLDLDFFVPDALAKPVRSAVDDFLNKHGA
jgi:hypothetical protein